MVSIIVLTCNNLESATKPFIDSLFQCTREDTFELIIVDNGSTDGTVDYLKKLSSRHPNIKLILNDENNGFSKGMNQGLSVAKGDVLFLMNNDILFPANWLSPALTVINRPEAGLVSPVVNRYGDGITARNYVQKAEAISRSCGQGVAYQCFVPFCCVGFRREVFERIGYLDEAFTPAYYEDNDYCLRSLYSGYKNAIALQSFVFHNHCQTSGKLLDRTAILKRNLSYYCEKHLIAQYIETLRNENKSLRKKLLSYRIKKIVIEFICFFVYSTRRKKTIRNRLKYILHLTSNDSCNYASKNIDYF